MKSALTGGIATGKTTVGKMFEELGARIIDADKIAHEFLSEPGIVERIKNKFGSHVLSLGGTIDRKKLGKIIFVDKNSRRWLNELIHPLVRQKIKEILENEANVSTKLTIVDVPLLIESKMHETYGPIILAYCPLELQIKRLRARDTLTFEEAVMRINTQIPIEAKKRFADFIIDTSGSFAETRLQVEAVYDSLIKKK